MRRPTVLLADDHGIVVEGLRRILEPEFEVVGAVADGRALLTAAEALGPDIVVVDISMPLLNGIEAARQIRKTARKTKIIFLTMHTDVIYATEALEAGGSGYVLKSSAGTELLTAVREVLRGRRYVTPAIAETVTRALTSPAGRRGKGVQDLTRRQREVLQLVAEGRTLKEIATILNVSPRTAEFHKYRVMEELGVRTTAELTQYAIKHGIVGP